MYAFRNVLHLAAASATLLAAPASGQLKPEAPIGSRLAKPLDEYPIDDTRRVLADFGACVVKREPQLARDLLLKSTQYSFAPEFQKLPTADCLGSAAVGRISGNGDIMLQMSPAVMRFVTAEALVRQDLANLDPQQLKSALKLPGLQISADNYVPKPGKKYTKAELTALGEYRARSINDIAIIDYGECVVRADPYGAKTLLATRISSEEEGTALRAMMPALSGCLNQGQKFGASRLILRGTVALGYYRLANAPKAPTSGLSPLPTLR